MRIAIAGIAHETNTFCRDLTRLEDFRVLRGEQILSTGGQQTPLGGFVDVCADKRIEPVPIVCASAQPSGIIARNAYDALEAEILDGLRASAALDGVVLALHGAGVVEGIDDLEGELAAAVPCRRWARHAGRCDVRPARQHQPGDGGRTRLCPISAQGAHRRR